MMRRTWVEMHVPSAPGLRQTMEANPMTGVSLEVAPLDPATGDQLPVPPDVATVQESFADPNRLHVGR